MRIIFKNLFVLLLSSSILTIVGCGTFSWPNPNIGERTADIALGKKDYVKALDILYRRDGQPWAQFRLGYMHETGLGVSKDYQKAMYWYLRASVQMVDDAWSKGKGIYGKSGFYAQNYDAYNSQIAIANLYREGLGVEKNSVEAYLWMNYGIRNAIKDDNGPIPKELMDTFDKLKSTLTDKEKLEIEIREITWEPSKSDIFKALIIDTKN